ncbi:MAG: 30S ribosome-binding factor RbfA [Clostridiales Family XIII bacterium]|jgi:phosphoesterase RecJ-like protein|nr:30S ribosome-binding factor RbfA [Clostridiales Family XIII bacterium]
MKRTNHRGEKLSGEIKRILGEMLTRELKDPLLSGMISITHVKTADDGSFATVYFTSLAEDEADVIKGFEKAKGFIRSEIGSKLGVRRTPELRFKADDAEKYGIRIDSLLNELDIPKDAKEVREIRLSEAAPLLDEYERFLLFTHIHMDGDTFGSAVALALALREVGKTAWVVVGEEPPRTLGFIDYGVTKDAAAAEALLTEWLTDTGESEEDDAEDADGDANFLGIALDYAGIDRLEGRESIFEKAAVTLCIDHHVTSKPECDFNVIEPDAAATAEMVYRLIGFADLPLTEQIATAIYVGIVTDTGRFQYSNTTPLTMEITAALMRAGADTGKAYQEIYQSVKAEKLLVEREMLDTMELLANGRAAIAWISSETLETFGAGDDETDGMSEKLRSIIGVEVSAFIKERPDGKIKVSMRSKETVDVAAIAAAFGGGGHVRAAGFTADGPLEDVVTALKAKLEAEWTGF